MELGVRVADMKEIGSTLRSRSFLSLKWLASLSPAGTSKSFGTSKSVRWAPTSSTSSRSPRLDGEVLHRGRPGQFVIVSGASASMGDVVGVIGSSDVAQVAELAITFGSSPIVFGSSPGWEEK